jgi:hypothetical protein
MTPFLGLRVRQAAARFWRRVAADAGGDDAREERRPVPGKPEIPPDVWITITVG